MKNLLFVLFVLMVFLMSSVFSQEIIESIPDSVPEDVLFVVQALPTTKTPNVFGIVQGGREKTASGTLRVLVIIVRFKDDVSNLQL